MVMLFGVMALICAEAPAAQSNANPVAANNFMLLFLCERQSKVRAAAGLQSFPRRAESSWRRVQCDLRLDAFLCVWAALSEFLRGRPEPDLGCPRRALQLPDRRLATGPHNSESCSPRLPDPILLSELDSDCRR